MKNDEITSPLHARRMARFSETEYRDHLRECVTCATSRRSCSIANELRNARSRYGSIYRGLRGEGR